MADETENRVFKPLEACQRALTYVSVCAADENTSKWKRVFFKVYPLIMTSILLSMLIVSIAYFLRFVSTDLESTLSCLYQIVAFSSLLYSIIVTCFMRQSLLAMFESLEEIYDASKKTLLLKIHC